VQLYGHIIREEEGRCGRGRREKEGRIKGGSQGTARRDDSHEWGREGSGDCGIRQRKAMYQNQAGTALSAVEACYYFIFDRSPSIRSLR